MTITPEYSQAFPGSRKSKGKEYEWTYRTMIQIMSLTPGKHQGKGRPLDARRI